MKKIIGNRKLLKDEDWDYFYEIKTDQKKRIKHPPIEEPFIEGGVRIKLIPPQEIKLQYHDVMTAISKRESRRSYSDVPVTMEQLSYLLWATQGIRRMPKKRRTVHYRTVPSAGGRHPIGTHLFINLVENLDPGIYRYLPTTHELGLVKLKSEMAIPDFENIDFMPEKLFWKSIIRIPIVFAWTAIPYRTEWRYGKHAAKPILLDAGHVCQNLYIACESIDLGTCAMGAWDQKRVDDLIGVNGEEEFTIYMAYVGNIKS